MVVAAPRVSGKARRQANPIGLGLARQHSRDEGIGLRAAQFAGMGREAGTKRRQPQKFVTVGLGQPLFQRAQNRWTAQVPVLCGTPREFLQAHIRADALRLRRLRRVLLRARSLDPAFVLHNENKTSTDSAATSGTAR